MNNKIVMTGNVEHQDCSVNIRFGGKYSISSFDILILSAWAQVGLLFFVNVVLNLLTGTETLSIIATLLYYATLIMLSFAEIKRHIHTADIAFVAILIVIVILSYNLNVSSRPYILDNIPELFFTVIPFYFVGLFFKSNEMFIGRLYRISVIAILLNWLYIIVFMTSGRVLVGDNMTMGYQVLPYAIVVTWYALRKPSTVRSIIAIIGVLFILGMGTRGPLLSIVLFIVAYLLLKPGKKKALSIVMLFTAGLLMFLLIITGLYVDLFVSFGSLLNKMGVSTRIIDSILYNSAESSGLARARIYNTLWSAILDKPYTGYGIYGEWAIINYHSHNIVYGLWIHFGFIFGSLIMIWLVWKFIKALNYCRNECSCGLFLVLLTNGLIRCFFSGTYLTFPLFLVLGFAIKQCRSNEKVLLKR